MSKQIKISVKKLNKPVDKCYFKIYYGGQGYTSDYCLGDSWDTIKKENAIFDYDPINKIHIGFHHGIFSKLVGSVHLTKEHCCINYSDAEHQWFNLLGGGDVEASIRIGFTIANETQDTFVDTMSIQDMYDAATQENEESIKISQRCLKMLEQNNLICNDVIESLDTQSRTIEKANEGVSVIESNIKNSKRKLRGIELIFGPLINKFTKRNKIKYEKKKKSKSVSDVKVIYPWENNRNEESKSDIKINKSVDVDAIGYNATQLVIDKNVRKMQNALDEHKIIATKINRKLKEELEQTDNLKNKVDKINPQMEDIARRSRIVVKKK
jgi:hypothetical protein